MLAEAIRLARLGTTLADGAFMRLLARGLFRLSTAYLIAAVFALVAAIFLLVAGYLGLEEAMPGWAAALVMAAVAVILAGLAMLVGRGARRRLKFLVAGRFSALAEAPASSVTAATVAPLVDQLLRATRGRMGESVLLAVAAGLIAGRLFGGGRKR